MKIIEFSDSIHASACFFFPEISENKDAMCCDYSIKNVLVFSVTFKMCNFRLQGFTEKHNKFVAFLKRYGIELLDNLIPYTTEDNFDSTDEHSAELRTDYFAVPPSIFTTLEQ